MDWKNYKTYFAKIILSKDAKDKMLNNLSLADQESRPRKKFKTFYKATAIAACLLLVFGVGLSAFLHNSTRLNQEENQAAINTPSENPEPENPEEGIIYNPFGEPNALSLPQFLLGSLIYTEIPSSIYSTEYVDLGQMFAEEAINRDHIGEAIGTVTETELSELMEAKIYEYTPVQGQRIVVVQKDDLCSLFRFVSLLGTAMCKMEDVFGVYGILSAQDVKSIKILKQDKRESESTTITDKTKISEFLNKIKSAYKKEGNNWRPFDTIFYKFILELNDDFLLEIDFSPDAEQISTCSAHMELTPEMCEYLLGFVGG